MLKDVRRRLIAALVIASCVIISGAFVVLFFLGAPRPPTEKRLIANFYAHRATYENLRDMLIADQQLRRVASWGVLTTKGLSKPPGGDFSVDRYNQYIVLLKEVGAVGASREATDGVGVLVYASGFAADTRHVMVVWTHNPAEQVSSLDDFYRTPKPRTPVYRHIDGNWYLWPDW